ncbi:tRNA methyltransferase 10 C, partial [Blomia tropicalis]
TCSSRNSVEAKRKLINAEFELLKHCNPDKTPNELKESDINYLMTLDETKTERKFTLDVSYKLRRQTFERLSNLQVFDGHEHLMLPFIGSEVNERLLRRRQLSMIPFLSNIIFDVSFDDTMSNLECKNLAEQLVRIFNWNKFGFEIRRNNSNLKLFNLHVANLGSSTSTRKFLNSLFDTSIHHYYPNVFFHQQPFTDIFDTSKLVYLSPHANETLTEFDNDVFYIIGGIVDRQEIVELTPNKSHSLGIRSVKLPLESLVNCEVQSLYTVYKFLHEFKFNPSKTADMSKLVKEHIPRKMKRLK